MEDLFEEMQENARALWCPSTIKRLNGIPSSAQFFKEYVATSTPVIISGGAATLRMAGPWDDLASLAAPDQEVTVDFTPDGRGDCVVELDSRKSKVESGEGLNLKPPGTPVDVDTVEVFVKPEERKMRFNSFVDLMLPIDGNGENSITSSTSKGRIKGEEVPYLSHQNDSLRQEFPGLMADVEPFLELAREAFGNDPEAVNLWIGDQRSVSAVHKDHYENMYCVVTGQKIFTLLPPSDILFLYEQDFPQGRYRRKADGTGFELEIEEGSVPWIPLDPACPDLEKYPLFRHASPVTCCVGPGDILYLPALWYHRVAQEGLTIAVNYWHDMQFDFKYVYYRFLQGLSRKYFKNVKMLLHAGGEGTIEEPAQDDEDRG